MGIRNVRQEQWPFSGRRSADHRAVLLGGPAGVRSDGS